MNVGTLTLSATTTISLNYIPQVISIEDSASAVTSLVVESNDYGIHLNLDTNGFEQMGAAGFFGPAGAISRFYIATGNLPLQGQSCRITATLGAGADRDVFTRSERNITPATGDLYRTSTIQALGNSETVLNKFSYLGLGNLVAGDLISIEYNNGRIETNLSPFQLQEMYLEDFGAVAAATLNSVPTPSLLMNFDSIIKEVRIIPAADRNVYMTRLQSIKAVSAR